MCITHAVVRKVVLAVELVLDEEEVSVPGCTEVGDLVQRRSEE